MTPEATVAKDLGLTRPQIVALRHQHLALGEHWQKDIGRGRKILWTDEGIAKIKQVLDLSGGVPAPMREQAEGAAHAEGSSAPPAQTNTESTSEDTLRLNTT